MSRFLTEDMVEYQKITPKRAEELRAALKNSVALIRSLLGRNAFKRFYRGDGKAPGGHWETKQFNASLYDILMNSFSTIDKNSVMANLDAIREAFIVLMTQDQEFIEAIELSTSSMKAVRTRFDKLRVTLEAILAMTVKQPRCFSHALKEGLYATNSTCGICGQHIADLDDAAVDHIEMYWLGGKTIPENARLAHRYCNWARRKAA